MKRNFLIIGTLLLVPLLLVAYVRDDAQTSPSGSSSNSKIVQAAVLKTGTTAAPAPVEKEVIELDWDALIPADWQLDKLLEKYDANNLEDDDPRALELMEKLKQFWAEAPVVHDFDGKTVKLPGYVVPLEMDATSIQEFLLVPYYGACIHTPPPPANQTVYVVTDEGRAYQGQLFDTVWVTGVLKVDKLSSELGDAGYRIEASMVEPYQ